MSFFYNSSFLVTEEFCNTLALNRYTSKVKLKAGTLFKILSICLLVSLSSPASSQTFSKLIHKDGFAEWGNEILQLSEDSIIVVGSSLDYSVSNWKLSVLIFNKQGDILIRNDTLIDGLGYIPFNSLIHPDGKVYAFGELRRINPSLKNTASALKISRKGVPLKVGYYPLQGESRITGVNLSSDGNIWTIGESRTFGVTNSDIIISKIDTGLNVLFSQQHGGTRDDRGFSIYQRSDDSLIIGGWSKSYAKQGHPIGNGDPVIWISDPIGNVGQIKNYGKRGPDGSIVFYEYDGTFFYGSCAIDTMTAPRITVDWPYESFFFKCDESGNLQWRVFMSAKDGLARQTTDVKFSKDSSVVYVLSECVSAVVFLAAVDTNGNLLWERYFYADTVSGGINYARSLMVDDEGFIWLTGSATLAYGSIGRSNDLWVARLDSMGCLEPGCHLTGIQDLPSHTPFIVGPNPSNGSFTVMFEKPTELGSVIQIYDLQGKLVHKEVLDAGIWDHRLSTEGLAAGTYVLDISHDGQSIGSRKIEVQR